MPAGANGFDVTAPGSVERGTPWDLVVDWDLPSLPSGELLYGVVLLSSDGSGSGNVMNLGIDLLSPPSVYLPNVRNKFDASPAPPPGDATPTPSAGTTAR